MIDHLEDAIGRSSGRESTPVDHLQKPIWIAGFHHIHTPAALLKRGPWGALGILATTKSHHGMVGGVPLISADLSPGLTDLFSQMARSRRGLEADLPMRVAECFGRCHRIALLGQRLGQGIKGERRHRRILDLQVVGKDESGHNKQCSR